MTKITEKPNNDTVFGPKFLRRLGLSDFEFSEIKKRLKRTPNLLEAYLFSAMWSEHCGYKHSKKYLSLLPSKNALFKGENSGGISLRDYIIFFKTESHNHPSAVEPYQGAATGIGGILRDILAMNARPIALLNSLKFGEIESRKGSNAAAASIKRNKYLLNGVVDGISDYANSTGVPTIGGEVSFNGCFNLSPLVNVMAVGLCHKNNVKTSAPKPGSNIVLIGSATGRDGLFGAAFASKELENGFEDRLSVQIGDPYVKKNLIEAALEILKSKNVHSSQDLGAAGLLSSTSEMAAKGGVEIDLYLDKVPLREKNMAPYEIMLSESQERMVFSANDRGVREIFKICKKFELNAAVIGKTARVRGENMYNLYYNGVLEASVPVNALVEPVLYDLNPKKPDYINLLAKKTLALPDKINTPNSIKHLIFKMAAAPEFSDKKYVYRQYDSTVGARTLKTPHSIGVAPLNIFETSDIIGFSMDSNEAASYLDPYKGAFNLIFEGFRNAVSSGFEPLGITNCLNFANPEFRDVAWQFTETINGMKDALKTLGIPVVSGNVSFYNEGAPESFKYQTNPDMTAESSKLKIYPSPVIGVLSVLKAKNPIYTLISSGDTVFLIGKQIDSASPAGASLYQKIFFDFLGGALDTVDVPLEMKLKNTIFKLSKTDQITGAIDVSKGGTLGALLIMLFNSFRGLNLSSPGASKLGFSGGFEPDIHTLFGEITGRYLISAKDENGLEKYFIKNNIPFKKLGKADATGVLNLGFTKINFSELFEIYENSFERKAT